MALHFEHYKENTRAELLRVLTTYICRGRHEPSPALCMLAEMPFPIIITTNYDNLFERALAKARRRPRLGMYNPERRAFIPPGVDRDPILFKLHGDFTRPESIVITEEDYIHFLELMGNDRLHPVPLKIRASMQEWRILFVGYSLRDYNLRLLLRSLRWSGEVVCAPPSFSVDPCPDHVILAVERRNGDRNIVFEKRDLWDFVPELYERVMGRRYPP